MLDEEVKMYKFLLVIVISAILSSCSSESEQTRDISTQIKRQKIKKESEVVNPKILGEWTTGKVLSQLGESITQYRFNNDGSFTITTTLIQMNQKLSGKGSFETNGDQLILKSPNKESKSTYYFEGNDLIIIESDGDKFRLKRK